MRVPTNQLYDQNIRAIMRNQRGLAQTQESLSTGKRINNPSDDPVGAAKVVRITESIDKLTQFQRNNDLLMGNLDQQEVVLGSIADSARRARVLALRSGSGALSFEDREAIAAEVEQIRNQVFDLMNAQNANGDYIFSGYQSETQAYEFNPSSPNPFTYIGDSGTNSVKLSDSVEVRSSVSGQQVFENTFGRFNFDLTGLNDVTLTAQLNSASITEQGSYDVFYENNYDNVTVANNEFRFSVIAGSQLELTNVGTGAVVTTIPFSSGSTFTFAGIEFNFSGGLGDSFDFTLRPPDKQNIAETLNNLVNALNDDTISNLQLEEFTADAIIGIDNSIADIETEISSIGGRINTAQSIYNTNADLEIVYREQRSEVEDTDFAEASAEFARQETALQAVFSTFPRISNLSLFNFIS